MVSVSTNMAKKGHRTETAPMTWDQFQTLIGKMTYDIDNKLKDDLSRRQHVKFFLLIAIGCYTGLRCSDLLSLSWSTVLSRDSFELTELKTGKVRKVTLNESLTKLLRKYVDYVRPVTYNERIFTDKDDNGVMSIQYINRKLKSIMDAYKVKVKNPSSHTLRKTFGLRVFELNYKSDEALITLSQIFNHSNTQVTRRYIGLQDKKIEDVYLSL